MKLYAISDLHLAHAVTRDALKAMPAYPEDWLIVAGDVGESEEHLVFALETLKTRFAKLLWVPGNHDLWTIPTDKINKLRGVEKYNRWVEVCRQFGVLTPEDPYVMWEGEGPQCQLAPVFTLFDYTFHPADVPHARALDWAKESGVESNDEYLLHPDPYHTREAWCAARCDYTEQRLAEVADRAPFVLINHFPILQELARLPRIPRFSLWCGTQRTEDWCTRFNVLTVVYGHLHIRSTNYRNGVRHEEVSLGYPRDWYQKRGIQGYLREILPGPAEPPPQVP